MSYQLKSLTTALLVLLLSSACSSLREPLPLSPIEDREQSLSGSVTTGDGSTDRSSGEPFLDDDRETLSVPRFGGSSIESNSNFASLLRSDASYVAVSPFRWDRSSWGKAGLAVAAVGGAMLLDETARNAIEKSPSPGTNAIADAIEPLGAEYSWGVLGAFYLSGRYFGNERAGAIARDGLASSLIAAGAITPLLKLATGRSRPSQTEGTFISGEGGGSFPSGHTTQAFALASVIASHYDSRWVKGAAYTLAGAVGWARMENNAHYASDVVAGALIGTIVGKTVVKLHDNRRLTLEASPSLDPNAPGVALSFRASSSDFFRLLRRSSR